MLVMNIMMRSTSLVCCIVMCYASYEHNAINLTGVRPAGVLYALIMSIMREITQKATRGYDKEREMWFFVGWADPLLMKYENLWYERAKKK